MNQNEKEIAIVIDALNKRDGFSCIPIGNTHYDNFKNNFATGHSLLNNIALLLKSTKNGVEKKDAIAAILADESQYAGTIKKTIELYDHRNIWLPIEHVNNVLAIAEANPKMTENKPRFLNAEEYALKGLQITYNSLKEPTKELIEFGFYQTLLEDALSDKGLEKLRLENERYRAAQNIIPKTMLETYKEKITPTANPLEFILGVLKIYSETFVTMTSETIEILN